MREADTYCIGFLFCKYTRGEIMNNSFYKRKGWRVKRVNILKRDNYECQECKRYGKSVDATTVHHIYPYQEYPLLALESDNLISLCNRCHELMHDRGTQEITALGKAWQTRADKKLKNKNFKDKK